jgi:hypothetical protein
VNALSGTAAPFAPDTAVGFAEPELGRADDEADGLGEELAAPPVAEVAVTTLLELELALDPPVVVAEGAIADRT